RSKPSSKLAKHEEKSIELSLLTGVELREMRRDLLGVKIEHERSAKKEPLRFCCSRGRQAIPTTLIPSSLASSPPRLEATDPEDAKPC
ncbi:MAG: hypothetical protein ACE5IB_06120, partial [Candidatus Geothermarchaeales archaeon]